VVRRSGETLVSLTGGHADRHGREPWRENTLALSFSTTKGASSTVIHRLADRGLVDYDTPVAEYWPAFGTGGKHRVTVRDLLTHRAGLASVRAIATDAEELLDHAAMERRLAARAPFGAPTPGSAYHAVTYGWLVSGLARAVTGQGMAELFRTEIAEPLGTDGIHLGARGDALDRVADPVGNALRQASTAVGVSTLLWSRVAATRRPIHALLVPGFHRLFEGPDPPIWRAEMPAVNGAFSADGLARLYGALANGGSDEGRTLLSPSRTAELGRVQLRSADAVLGLRMRWRLGYHQAFGTGRDAPMAFGHYGYGGSGGWADPATGLSLGFVTNRIGSLTTPLGDLNLFRLSALARRCARTRRPLRRG